MSDLYKLQQQMQAHILKGDAQINDKVFVPDNIVSTDRLSIYRNGYYERCINALTTDYPALQCAIGEAAFAAMVRAYVECFPSDEYSLHQLGKNLKIFLEANSECHPGFIELVELETFVAKLQICKDAAKLDPQALTLICAENFTQVQFILHPSVNIFTQRFNSVERWRSLLGNQDGLQIKQLECDANYALWRPEYQIRYQLLTQYELSLLTLIHQGCCLGELCKKMLAYFSPELLEQQTIVLLQNWISAGIITKIDLG